MAHSFDFTTLPQDLCRHLLLGFSGRLHLHASARVALHHSHRPGDACSVMAGDMLLAAWGENPFDGNCVGALAGNAEKTGPLPSVLLPVMKSVLSHWQPEITPEARAAMSGGPEEQLGFLRHRLAEHPESLFWWHHLYELSRINGNWSILADALAQASPPEELTALFSYAHANALLASDEVSAAYEIYGQCVESLPLPIIEERIATALVRSGKGYEAATLLKACVEKRPWNISLWLRQHELSLDGAVQTTTLQGRKMVLAYSWNKADDLAETLQSLSSSNLDDEVHVRILDNGSTDHTKDVIASFKGTFGSDKVESVVLPINAGAPAARNWLLSLPEVRQSAFSVFIDDDISLPKDWLTKLGAATERYPDAGVWGCKVVDFDGPARVQCGEHNLTPLPEGRRESLMSTIMLQDGDFGQADYVRPCASVTGCVHLFKTDRLLANGDFDLRFSPTQYDDLERDLRMVLSGGYAVYCGHVAIRHKRKSGSMSESGQPESGGAAANMHKLMAKYAANEFEAMASVLDAVLLKDLRNRQEKLT